MLYPSAEFSEWIRLKGKSRKMFGIKQKKTFFFKFRFGGPAAWQPRPPPFSPWVRPDIKCV